MILSLLPSTSMVARTPADQLIKRLKKLNRLGVMIGHQDDPVYGRQWKWEEGRSDVKGVCGDYPALMGFDLGELEIGRDRNLDGVNFDRMRKEIIAQHERGGVVTISWHPRNPVTGESAWDPSGKAVTAILPGGERNTLFQGWLTMVANFIRSLRTTDGKQVPVIFRPWHEMSGGWFWWGSESCTPEEYRKLYCYTVDQLQQNHHCKNIVWAYSPNTGVDSFEAYYPGDDYVDVVGTDIYDFDHNNLKFQKAVRKGLQMVEAFAKKHNKIPAFTETGAQTLPDPTWFTGVLWPVLKEFNMSYVLFWRNAWDNKKELYMSYPGHATEDDFKKFYELKPTLFVEDIKRVR